MARARPASLLAVIALLALAAVLPGARAHTPVVNKKTLSKKGKTVFTLMGEAPPTIVPVGEQQPGVGDRMISDCIVAADGHGHFPRYLDCTIVSTDFTDANGAKLGVAYQCLTETYFALGSVLSQGTLFLRNGVFSGNVAVIGGTAEFKSVRGVEVTTFDTSTGTGTTKFFLS